MNTWTVDSAYPTPVQWINGLDLGAVFADVLNDDSKGNLVEFLGDEFLMLRDDGVPVAFVAGWKRGQMNPVFQLQFFIIRPALRGINSGRVLGVVENTLRWLGYKQLMLPIRRDRVRFIRVMRERYGYLPYTDEDDEQNVWFYKNF